MRPLLTWIDKITEEDDAEAGSCIYDLAFKPDGSQLLVAVDNKVLVYDPNDGTLVTSLKGHKELVFCVSFAHTGEKFASGSQDKTVIVWSDQHEGLLKYTHNESIQCIEFSPTSITLLSCSITDFGIWGQNEKNVSKQKVASRCMSCAWNTDGQYYAIGMYDGSVSIRSAANGPTGEEIGRIERPSGEPVWAVRFGQPRYGVQNTEILAVADWNQSIGFYGFDGRPVHKADKVLNFDPSSLFYFNNGQFLIMCGSNKQVSLHTREGTDLSLIAQMDSWAWVAKAKPTGSYVVVGCVDGTLACYQLMFSTVHGLHGQHYAFRDLMTDVVVQHLGRQRSTRIRCNDLVRKVAVYNNRLAIQLSDKVLIYRQSSGEKDGEQLEYKLLDRINQNFECSLLVVTAHHLILCQDRRLQCYDHKGLRQREWTMEALIRYIKVIGGPPGREAILLGLRNGVVNKIFVDNPFPVEIVRLKNAIRCLDISLRKRKLATVDESGVCVIFDTVTKEILAQEPNCNSVAWNSENEDLFCYSGFGTLCVKSRNFTPYQQRLEGFVVGFTGKRVYTLHLYAMSTVEVPLTSQLMQHLDSRLYTEAYELACLGVTERDWKMFGIEALEHMEFQIAKKCFNRVKDCRSLMLINEVEEMKARSRSEDFMRAYVYAYAKRFREAAQLLQEAGAEQSALEMFSDLRMFDQAQEFLSKASSETQKSLLRKKADWAHSSNDLQMAADMLMASGDYDKAIRIMIENDWLERILNAARKLDRSEANLLREIGNYLARKGEYAAAANYFHQISDMKSIVLMHVNAEHWEDAFALVTRNPAFAQDVYLPYANWLAERDMFDEAQIAFAKAGHDGEAFRVLLQLTENAVSESRYMDASCYYRLLATRYLNSAAQSSPANSADANKAKDAMEKADIYYAYEPIFRYVIEPFTNKSLDVLLQMSRFLALKSGAANISKVCVLYTLAKLSRSFGCYKTARQALEQLRTLRAPIQYQSLIDIATVEIRAKPFSDAEEFMPMCYSCGTNNPILGGHQCVHCDAEFVYSFVTFEVLPLVEFRIQDGITKEEAVDLIEAEPPVDSADFTVRFAEKARSGVPKLTKDELLILEKGRVLTCSYPAPLPSRYFFKIISEINIAKCEECHKFFHADDFQMAVLQTGLCPVCRMKVKQNEERLDMDDEDDSAY